VTWRLLLQKAAEKALDDLPDRDRDRIIAALRRLASDPFAARAVKALAAREDFRLRVGDYRVLYSLEPETRTLRVERIGQRGASMTEAYSGPQRQP